MPTSARGGALPANPLSAHLAGSSQPTSLPDNPLAAHLSGKTAVAPQPTQSPLTGYAQRIVNEQIDPAFVQHLQTLAKADPTFQTRLNAETARLQAAMSKQQGAGLGGELHGFKVVGKDALAIGAALSGASTSKTPMIGADGKPVLGPDGKPLMVSESTVGIPGIGRAAGVLKDAAGIGKVGRDAVETETHIAQASKNALAEGYGPIASGGIKNAPKVRPGEITPATGGHLGAQVRSALKGRIETPEGVTHAATPADMRAAQQEAQSAVRAERVAKAQAALKKAGGGAAGEQAALKELQGELPKIHWNNQIRNLDQQTLDEMIHFVQNHPALRFFEQRNTVKAIQKMVNGHVPTAGEQQLLERAFGRETAGQLSQLAKSGGWKKLAVDVLNLPRAIMASTDLSAPLRQGLVAGVAHPVMTGQNLVPMLRMAKSEDFYQAAMDAIHGDQMYPLAHKAGLALTDIGKDAAHGAAELGGREEARMSNLAEHMPGNNQASKAYNKTFGALIRGSDRAYVGFLNKTRMDYFRRLVTQAAQQGHDVNDEELLKSIAKVVNTATGRGNVPGALQDHLATMNALFFSPRLLASRINLLNPLYYVKLDPFARREALKAFVSLGATAFTVLELAKMAGAQVNTDPTNADFAKIKLGNTRIDFLGGFQQPVRLAAQLYENKLTSSTTGKAIPLGTGFAKTSRYDVVVKFLQGKFSPVPSLVVATLKGQDYTGQPVKWGQLSTWERAAANNMVPFLAQDLYSLYTTSGPNGLFAGPLDLFGVGVQSYKAKTPTGRGGSGSGGGFSGGGGGFGDNSGGFGSSSGGFGG